jgi:hypothetical protein
MSFVDKTTDFETFKSEFKNLNWFLIENSAFGRHLAKCRDASFAMAAISLGESSKKKSGNAKGWIVEKIHARKQLNLFGGEDGCVLGVAGQAAHLALGALSKGRTVSDAGTGDDKALEPKKPYIIALDHERNGEGPLETLAAFMTNPVGSAIVNADGAIRQVVHGEAGIKRRHFGIAEGHPDKPGPVVQVH